MNTIEMCAKTIYCFQWLSEIPLCLTFIHNIYLKSILSAPDLTKNPYSDLCHYSLLQI